MGIFDEEKNALQSKGRFFVLLFPPLWDFTCNFSIEGRLFGSFLHVSLSSLWALWSLRRLSSLPLVAPSRHSWALLSLSSLSHYPVIKSEKSNPLGPELEKLRKPSHRVKVGLRREGKLKRKKLKNLKTFFSQ